MGKYVNFADVRLNHDAVPRDKANLSAMVFAVTVTGTEVRHAITTSILRRFVSLFNSEEKQSKGNKRQRKYKVDEEKCFRVILKHRCGSYSSVFISCYKKQCIT